MSMEFRQRKKFRTPYWLPGYERDEPQEDFELFKGKYQKQYRACFRRKVGFSGPLIPLSFKNVSVSPRKCENLSIEL
jgi:hypothetical protein